jgi:hypothetical protein
MCSIIFMLGHDAHINVCQQTLQNLVDSSVIYLVLNATILL